MPTNPGIHHQDTDYIPMGSIGAWNEIKRFKPFGTRDQFGDYLKIDRVLIETVASMREFAGHPFHVLCGSEARPRNKGWHPKHQALDGYFDNIHPLEMYEIAQRFDKFNGIGVYLWWTGYNGLVTGGIHLDTRPKVMARSYDARWGQVTKHGAYMPVKIEFLRQAVVLNLPREKRQ